MFQVSTTMIYFTNILWPEFTIWHLLGSIFYYQRHISMVMASRQNLKTQTAIVQTNNRVKQFLDEFEERQIKKLENLIKS